MKRALTEQDIIRAKRFNYTVFAILLAGLLALGVWLIQYHVSHTFTPEKWQTATEDQRLKLYGDLLAKYELKGMRVEEVIELLGQSDDAFEASEDHLVYYLGTERYQIDACHLVLTVKDGIVTKVEVKTD